MCTDIVTLGKYCEKLRNSFTCLLGKDDAIGMLFLKFLLSFSTGIIRAHCASIRKTARGFGIVSSLLVWKVIKFVINSYVPWFFPWIKTLTQWLVLQANICSEESPVTNKVHSTGRHKPKSDSAGDCNGKRKHIFCDLHKIRMWHLQMGLAQLVVEIGQI